jgi:mono/diheme cytochrome c family protein
VTGATSMNRVTGAIIVVLALALLSAAARAEERFAPEQIRTGAEIFARNCSPCHGPRMQEPEGAFDLRAFPHDQHARFVNSVTRGKNQMPPWGDLLKADEVEALWAYVVAGER